VHRLSWPVVLLAVDSAVFVWSAIGYHDFFTWALEVFPAVIGIAVLIWLYPRFRFTNLVYTLIAVHAIILMIGGHYTYAEMPLFNWVRDTFHQSRNHYDRLGHFAQGFVPSLIAREVLLRTTALRRGKLLLWLILSSSMAISALYELLEFAVAMATGSAADAFLGGQGDVWDTQWDMTFCLIGTICALLFMSRFHDEALARLSDQSTEKRQRLGFGLR
jgi:putative membrane protein